jgi:hypothetical protein
MLNEPPERSFGQTVVIRLALTLLVFLPLGAIFSGVAMSSAHRDEATWPWATAALVCFALVVWTWRAFGRVLVSIHGDGVRRRGVFSTRELRWDEIAEYRYRAIRIASRYSLYGMVASAVSNEPRSLIMRLVGKNGGRIRLDSNVKDAPEAISLAVARVHAAMLPELQRRFDAGETLRFGHIELSQRGVAERGNAHVPFAQVDEVTLTGERLRVKQSGKIFAAASGSAWKIPNVLLLLELLQKQGIPTPALAPEL